MWNLSSFFKCRDYLDSLERRTGREAEWQVGKYTFVLGTENSD